MNINFDDDIKTVKDYVVSLRRYFHMYPETALNEYNTSAKIKEELSSLNIPFKEFGNTGVVGYIGKSDYEIALRADLDALNVTEMNECEYKSKKEGYMHGCGHDGHTAALLGAAKILKKHEQELNITILLLFQPAEENCMGAKLAIESGLLENVKAIFGIHIFSDIPYGTVSVTKGPRMAITDRFEINIKGKGGHAAKPHQCVDTAIVAANMLLALQTIVSRNVDPVHNAVVTVGKMTAGTQYNVIAENASLSGTVRTFYEEDAQLIKQRIENIASSISQTYNAKATVNYGLALHPAVINPDNLTEHFVNYLNNQKLDFTLQDTPPLMLGEDFSSYQTILPGIFAFAGGGFNDKENYPNHHCKFDFDERVLIDAVTLHLNFVNMFNDSSRRSIII